MWFGGSKEISFGLVQVLEVSSSSSCRLVKNGNVFEYDITFLSDDCVRVCFPIRHHRRPYRRQASGSSNAHQKSHAYSRGSPRPLSCARWNMS